MVGKNIDCRALCPCIKSLAPERWHQMPPELRISEINPADEGGDGPAPLWQRPHYSAGLTWLFAIMLPCLIFFAFVAPTLAHELSPAVPTVGAVLMLLSNALMALTSFTDPGKVPRASTEELLRMRTRLARAPQKVVVNGIQITTKFCDICGVQRPPRCSHCRQSDRCVEKWDHYCPWLGTAVGRRNYPFFVGFVWVTAALAASMGGFSVAHLVLVGRALRSASPFAAHTLLSIRPIADTATAPLALRAIAAAPLSGVLVLYCVVVGLALLVLGVFHLYLIGINQTTYENVSGRFHDRESNPFDRGALTNLGEVCLPCWVPPLKPSDADTAHALEEGARHCSTSLGAGAGAGPGPAHRGRRGDMVMSSTRHGPSVGGALDVRGGGGEPRRVSAAQLALEELDRQEAVRQQSFVQQMQSGEARAGQRRRDVELTAIGAMTDEETSGASTLASGLSSQRSPHSLCLGPHAARPSDVSSVTSLTEDGFDSRRPESRYGRYHEGSGRATSLPPGGEPPPSPKSEPWDGDDDDDGSGDDDGDDDGGDGSGGGEGPPPPPASNGRSHGSSEGSVHDLSALSGSLLSSSLSSLSRLPPPPPNPSGAALPRPRSRHQVGPAPANLGGASERVVEGHSLFLSAADSKPKGSAAAADFLDADSASEGEDDPDDQDLVDEDRGVDFRPPGH